MVVEYAQGVGHVLCLLHLAELDGEAFAKVAGAYPRRIELLDDAQQLGHLFVRGLDVLPEGYVVHDAVEVAAEIAVLVDAAYQIASHGHLMLVQVAETELGQEALGETLLDGEGVVFGTFVLAVVVDSQAVGRDGVVCVQLVDGYVLGLVVIVIASLDRTVVQHRIVLKLTFYTLFQFLDGEFDEFDSLDLKR
jgi:hypothetical protein